MAIYVYTVGSVFDTRLTKYMIESLPISPTEFNPYGLDLDIFETTVQYQPQTHTLVDGEGT